MGISLHTRTIRSAGLAVLVYVALGMLFLYPLSRLVVAAFTRDGVFTLENVRAIFTDRSNVSALVNSLNVGFVVTLISTTVGFLLSWLVVRTNLYWKRFLRFALVMPFYIPPFIMAFAWTRL